MSGRRGESWILAAVLFAAGGLRVAACGHWRDDLSDDPDAYHAYAVRLADGAGFVSPAGRPTAFRPPLYPLLLAAVGWAGPVGVGVLHVALGVGTVALTHAVGRRLGLGRWAMLAALLVAFDPLLLRYTPQVMTEVTCAFFAVLVLWSAAARRSAWLGIAFGLAVLSRPTFWVFGGLGVGVWAWGWLRARREGAAQSVRSALIVVAGTALCVGPWAMRNVVVFGRPVLTTTHGGYTLLLANNPVFWREVVEGPAGAVWDGESLDTWQRSVERDLAADGIGREDELARDRWMRDRALANIRREPAEFVRAAVYRVARFWDVAPAADGLPRLVRWGVTAFYGVIQAFAVAGGVWAVWDGGRRGSELIDGAADGGLGRAPWWPSVLMVVAFIAVHAVYWTDARMRGPVIPAVALLAAGGAAWVGRGLARRQSAGRT